jgi:hypothetical protein
MTKIWEIPRIANIVVEKASADRVKNGALSTS